ncbi:MAG: acyl-ACP--UDP-N-acetylglucosamine O-acyltransferase [Gammaproteobacteria bacterium]|nr:acyl-ACP--UDP-N-acetylglucosamine O-acyltransferase [Gammaproteobacteria bacterium]
MIAPGAIVDPDARISETATISAYSVIGAGVEIGEGSWIGPHVVIKGPTRIGRNNKIFQFCSIGDDPQDKKYEGESESVLEIGDNNVIREYCSINRGTAHGGGVTRLGDDNWVMAYVHIAHDCLIGNQCTFANNTTLAGHVLIEDHVILGGFTGVHQFCRMGKHSFSAISSVIVKDVPPYVMMSGNTAKPSGLNREGLKRHGFSTESIDALRKAYKTVYRDGLLLKDALEEIRALENGNPHLTDFVEFIQASERGIAR